MIKSDDPLKQYLDRQRRLEVDRESIQRVERNVMHNLLSQRERSVKFFRLSALGVGAATLALLLLFMPEKNGYSPKQGPGSNPAVVESVIILDNHVAVWLEPISKVKG